MTIAEMIKLGIKGFKPSDIRKINESGIATSEIIDLAENGYSSADVSELIQLAGEAEQVQPGNIEQTEPSGPAESSGYEGEKQDEYKAKYEAQTAELEHLKKQLEAAQNQNASRNLGTADQTSTAEKLHEIFKNIY